ncbi:MAG: glucose PTS transporter subunit EIIB [Rahnella inusitata]|jgi:PTS system glucose-specific IIB component|uniref:PTS sugar transporter n=1 Tax=Rahnella inusitata TaxID=58169 RepID=A0ABX9P2E8_9GAMM|nr:glucose PTS transporter subunit EIIB [Rahnella inusitata]QLK60712.1 PTS sugar transporter [Enterobacteriaceae bacterium Kacie_13]RJT14979.1 PTS sugar transporter [Rahnella inusitata]
MVNIKDFMHVFSAKNKNLKDEVPPSTDVALLIEALGGHDNIINVDACITRLRVKVRELKRVNSGAIQQTGAIGVVIIGQEVHAIFGKQSDSLKKLMTEKFGLQSN